MKPCPHALGLRADKHANRCSRTASWQLLPASADAAAGLLDSPADAAVLSSCQHLHRMRTEPLLHTHTPGNRRTTPIRPSTQSSKTPATDLLTLPSRSTSPPLTPLRSRTDLATPRREHQSCRTSAPQFAPGPPPVKRDNLRSNGIPLSSLQLGVAATRYPDSAEPCAGHTDPESPVRCDFRGLTGD